ncbi:hypothetical protein PLICRDRAFT_41828 [Plicaturopsis crispa FD-325 SS-3]|nr:hypothetical protein PLICRDRAFT_41828 [Plicaturopsis crispa FD-325 SS-3]
MSPIAEPQPRHAYAHSDLATTPFMRSLSSRSGSLNAPSPRAIASPQRLLSPISLVEPSPRRATSKPLSLHCRSSPRRRSTPSQLSRHRRRLCARSDCPFEAVDAPFECLPWISALEATPDVVDMWDLADLSQIVIHEEESCCAAGPGPVRRRKTSLRSSPLGSENSPARHPTIPYPIDCDVHLRSPRTPMTRGAMLPSQVRFHNLLPVYTPYNSHNDESRSL